ncbi:MAG: xanthine dehydrogenase family protein molybdopterin-binding subunit [Alphaproteobacteria bacterium]
MSLPRPIGEPSPQPRAARLLRGRGRYTDDLPASRLLHVAFVRSPHAHARIEAIRTGACGALAVVTAADLAGAYEAWTSRHNLFPDLKQAVQHPLAVDKARWCGEPVVAVVARTRAEAEDAAARVEIDWTPLPPLADVETALAPDAPRLHDDLSDNIAFRGRQESGDPDAAFAVADRVIEETFRFARHTGVTLEPRSTLAVYDEADGLTVYQSHQVPHQMQDIYADLLGLPEHRVRVVCPDVGGAYGIKLHLYPEDICACLLARRLGRPVKWVADRMESLLSDIHARDHQVTARMALDKDGTIRAFAVEDVMPIGAFSVYPRTSMGEAVNVRNMTGAPYRFEAYRCDTTLVFQNKNTVAQYRAVGHPIAAAITERLVDLGAAAVGLDPLELRRRNLLDAAAYTSPAGPTFEGLSLPTCLAALEAAVDVPVLRAEQASLREQNIYRGIGIASFIEVTATGPQNYGRGGIRISAQDGCALKLEPSGTLRCVPSVTEQGQGTEAAIAQIVAAGFGVAADDVAVSSGDSAASPYGGGAFASRGITIGGEAAWRAARQLRANVLDLAAAVLQADVGILDIRDGEVVDGSGARMSVAELAALATFRPFELPPGTQPELSVVGHYVNTARPFVPTCGMQLSHVEVDAETGAVRLLRHVVAHDCGRQINPLLVAEQIRGGVTQGLGAALWEEIVYDDQGQLLTASLADYLVPMAAELPDIEVLHVETPVAGSELGTRGAGEAGTAGASAAVLNAINDALAPLGGHIAQLPCTPERVLNAIPNGVATC